MLGLRLEKRAAPSFWTEIITSILSVGIGLFFGSFVIWAYGFNPIYVYSLLFSGGFGSFSALARTLTQTIPLLLVGLGLTFAFKAKVWNIGAPGQMIIGSIAAAGIALFFPFELPAPVHIALIFFGGFIAGAGFAAICGFLDQKIGLNIIISTLMLNYIAFKLLQHLIYGPWRNPTIGFPASSYFPKSAQLPVLAGTTIHYPTLVIGIVLIALTYLAMKGTKLGYEIKIFGESPKAAVYAGISRFKIIMWVMILSGGLAGLAGAGEVMGIHQMLKLGVDGAGGVYATSYGYTAIIVTSLGRDHALGTALAAFFIAGILVGGFNIQIIGVSYAVISVLMGLMFLSIVGGGILSRYKISFRRED